MLRPFRQLMEELSKAHVLNTSAAKVCGLFSSHDMSVTSTEDEFCFDCFAACNMHVGKIIKGCDGYGEYGDPLFDYTIQNAFTLVKNSWERRGITFSYDEYKQMRMRIGVYIQECCWCRYANIFLDNKRLWEAAKAIGVTRKEFEAAKVTILVFLPRKKYSDITERDLAYSVIQGLGLEPGSDRYLNLMDKADKLS